MVVASGGLTFTSQEFTPAEACAANERDLVQAGRQRKWQGEVHVGLSGAGVG